MPTDAIRRGFDRIGDVIALRSFGDFIGGTASDGPEVGVVLPPHVETSLVVESWEASEFLRHRFGRGAHIGNVVTLVDADLAIEHLTSAEPISARGWGAAARDARTVADIIVGQIESATHLALVGTIRSSDALRPVLGALNPSAGISCLGDASDAELRDFVTHSRRAPGGDVAQSARVVPPWLDLLQAESDAPPCSDRFLYRRSRPFDPTRFAAWLASPPTELVRGKGKVWLADRCDVAFGYSCAGSVHRVFPAGTWWASGEGSAWPTCETERRRLLDRWHPHFGDRRQEIVFVGVDLDPETISPALDACLVGEDEAFATVAPTSPTNSLH